MSPDTISIAASLGLCVIAFCWVVWVLAVNIRRGRTSRQVTEMHSRLLDRFANNQDLIAFLEGESGRRYFGVIESELRDPLARILSGIQTGVVLVLLGLSLLVVRMWQRDEFALNALLLIGVPGVALGAGFLISAAISYRLSKTWGLMDKR